MNHDRVKARAAEALRDGGLFAKFYAEDVPVLLREIEDLTRMLEGGATEPPPIAPTLPSAR